MTSRILILFLLIPYVMAASSAPDGDSLVFPIFADILTIRSKNETLHEPMYNQTMDTDELSEFINNHYIRIRLPLAENHFDVDLRDVFPENGVAEGFPRKVVEFSGSRGTESSGAVDSPIGGFLSKGRRKFGQFLLPIILIFLKLKSVIFLPALLSLVGLIALKGLWAGITSLLLWKTLALKFAVSHKDKDECKHPTSAPDYPEYDFRPMAGYPLHRGPRVPYRFIEYLNEHYRGDSWDDWNNEYGNRRKGKKNRNGV